MPTTHDSQRDERLGLLSGFGSNPGALLAHYYIPDDLPADAALVVVLHGCTQTAGGYNRGADWTGAADDHGFALLFPEQQRSNNPNLCFNWFSPTDATRGEGEPLSIVQMVEAMCERHGLDRSRVFVTGLSAGGAMTAVMLATYPDVFAGGASIAGLPFGTATSVPGAFEQMRDAAKFAPGRLSALVTSASNHVDRWPTLSVWHGSSDRTVDAGNATALIEQWRGLHAFQSTPTLIENVAGHERRVWRDADGVDVIEEYIIAGMGHGTPIDTDGNGKGGEIPGPYMLASGISSTRRIVAFWGLDRGTKNSLRREPRRETAKAAPKPVVRKAPTPSHPVEPIGFGSVQSVIEKALKKAGLM